MGDVANDNCGCGSVAQENDLRERELVGMRDGQLGRMAADRAKPSCCAAVQLQLRRAAPADDFDVAPPHALGIPGPERFHGRFFGGKPAGEVNRRLVAPHAICDFVVREDAVRETLAVALDGGGDAWNVGRVESQSDDVHASQA